MEYREPVHGLSMFVRARDPPQGAPTRVSAIAPRSAPIRAESSIGRPCASPKVMPAANESPQP